MDIKPCFKCGVSKPLNDFYKHPKMADGHLGKCKECTKKDANQHRENNIDKYRSYDRQRGNRQTSSDLRKYRQENPRKYRAHQLINYAVKVGSLFSEPCAECGMPEMTHAHHDDYAKPFNIRWLCPVCHKAWHKIHGEAPNGK